MKTNEENNKDMTASVQNNIADVGTHPSRRYSNKFISFVVFHYGSILVIVANLISVLSLIINLHVVIRRGNFYSRNVISIFGSLSIALLWFVYFAVRKEAVSTLIRFLSLVVFTTFIVLFFVDQGNDSSLPPLRGTEPWTILEQYQESTTQTQTETGTETKTKTKTKTKTETETETEVEGKKEEVEDL